MLTVVFIILKLTNTLLLSWWWISLALLFDLHSARLKQEAYRLGHQNGYDEGYSDAEDASKEIDDEDDYEYLDYDDDEDILEDDPNKKNL